MNPNIDKEILGVEIASDNLILAQKILLLFTFYIILFKSYRKKL